MAASVLLVQSDEGHRAAVHQALELRGGFVVVGEAADEDQALAAAEAKGPDLVVVDITMEELAGHSLIPRLRAAAPSSRVVVCSGDPGAARSALAGSADEYVDTRAGVAYLVELLTDMSRALYDSASIRLGLELEDVARARTFVSRQCEDWGCPAQVVQDAKLVASELVTNALVHAHSSCELQVRRAHNVLRLEVEDHGDGIPDVQEPGTQRESGRGLLVVSMLTAAWGSERTEDGGKRVWAELLTPLGAQPDPATTGAPGSSPARPRLAVGRGIGPGDTEAAIGLLRELSSLLAGAPALDSMLESCAQSLVRWFSAAFAGIWLLDPDGRTLVLRGSDGGSALAARTYERVELGRHRVGRIAETRQPSFTNALDDPVARSMRRPDGSRVVSFGGCPIVSQGELLGVVAICSTDLLGVRSEEILAAVADALAIGIRRLRAESALREESGVLEALYRVGGLISHERRVEAIVQAATDAATEMTGAGFGAFFHNRDAPGIEGYSLFALSGLPIERFADIPLPDVTPLFEPTFRGTAVVRSDDVTGDPRFGRKPPLSGLPPGHPRVRSYLAVPVMSRVGEVLGGLFFGSEQPGVFTDRSERIAVGIAAQAAAAIGSAMAYEREHRLALALQRSLLPHDVPTVPGLDIAVRYQAYGEGLEVGGDWYEVTTLRDGRVALSVGDAMGHDLGAAAAMTRVRHLLRAYAMDGHRPSEVLRKSDALLSDVGYVHMITALHAQFNPVTGTMIAASAGHPPPLVVGPDGDSAFGPLVLGPPLGVDLQAVRPDRQVQVEHGSTVVLYTDGLVERRDVPLVEGMARLEAALDHAPVGSAEDVCDFLLEELAAGTQDDVALLVLNRR